jgi:DNA-directed RNA polymerase specialized sigma subunit
MAALTQVPRSWWDDRDRYKERIGRHYYPLCLEIAKPYSKGHRSRYWDCVSVAGTGLSRAIYSYDPEHVKGANFSTFAKMRMRSELLHFIRDNSSVPRQWLETHGRVIKAAETLNNLNKKHGRSIATYSEVARRMRIDDWGEIANAMKHPNPIPLEGFEWAIEEDDRSQIDLIRLTLFKLPLAMRSKLEAFMFEDIRTPGLEEALEMLRSQMEAA